MLAISQQEGWYEASQEGALLCPSTLKEQLAAEAGEACFLLMLRTGVDLQGFVLFGLIVCSCSSQCWITIC